MKKKIDEAKESILPIQKQVNDKHAEGMPSKPASTVASPKGEPKSGVDQKKVDTDHAENSPSQQQSVAGGKKNPPAWSQYLQTKVDTDHAQGMSKEPSDVKSVMKNVNGNIWKSLETMINTVAKNTKPNM